MTRGVCSLDRNSASTQIKQGDLNPSWNEILILSAKIPMIRPVFAAFDVIRNAFVIRTD